MTTGSFPHDNFSSVYWIFTKLYHTIALWTGKNPIYFGVIRSKVTITINRFVYRLIIYIDGRILWCTHFLFFFSFVIILECFEFVVVYFFSTSLCIKTISSLLKLHFFSLFLSWEGGSSQPYIFFYLSAARIEQGIVGYIGLG